MTKPQEADRAAAPPSSASLIGAPWDEKSSFLRGAAGAPAAIREALWSDARNAWTEGGVDLGRDRRFRDAGDAVILDPRDDGAAMRAIEEAVAGEVARGAAPIVLGGDHAVTVPVLRALARLRGPFDVLQIDAHADLYEEYEGDRFSHACPFARAMEEGLCRRLVQVGVRTLTADHRARSARFGTELVAMRDLPAALAFGFERPVYVSIDLDGLDPAFAPAVAHPEPGGLSTREVLRILARLETPILGADVVEMQPSLPGADLTAVVAAKLVKEIAGLVIERAPAAPSE